MKPQFEPGYLRNGGAFVLLPRMRPCKFCGAEIQTCHPHPICSRDECQLLKKQRSKVWRQRYDAKRRSA